MLYETSLAGRREGAKDCQTVAGSRCFGYVLNKLLARASNATSFEMFLDRRWMKLNLNHSVIVSISFSQENLLFVAIKSSMKFDFLRLTIQWRISVKPEVVTY